MLGKYLDYKIKRKAFQPYVFFIVGILFINRILLAYWIMSDLTRDNLNRLTVYKYLPWVATIALFMQTLDGTILNTALPAIAEEFNREATAMQSVIVAYTLTLALFIPLSGWMSDRFGSRNIFICAVAIFTVGSLACALSQNLTQLVLSRILKAVGGSMMVPVARLSVLYTYSKSKQLKVINFMTIPALIGPIVGPTLGGWLVDYTSWHWIFLINLPMGILGMLVAKRVMPNYKQTTYKFDLSGMFLFGGALIIMTLAIELGTEKLLAWWMIVGLIAVAALMMQLYYIHYKKVAHPLINLSLIKIRTLRIGVLGNLLTRLGIGGMPLLLPLMFQLSFGHSAMTSGMMMIPIALAAIVTKPLVVKIVQYLGYKNTLLINTIIIAFIISLFAYIDADTPLPILIPLLVIYGVVNSIQLSSMNTLAVSDLDKDSASSGNSLVLVMQQLSMSLGISVGAFLLQYFGEATFIQHPTLQHAFKLTFVAMGIITAISALLFLRLDRNDGAAMSSKK